MTPTIYIGVLIVWFSISLIWAFVDRMVMGSWHNDNDMFIMWPIAITIAVIVMPLYLLVIGYERVLRRFGR